MVAARRHAAARQQIDDAARGADRGAGLRRDARHQCASGPRAAMPTRGATASRCLESTRVVKNTATKTAAIPRPTTLNTCFMATLEDVVRLSSNGRARRVSDAPSRLVKNSRELYIFTVCHARPARADLARRSTSARVGRRARQSRAAAPCGRSSTATRGRPARATTTAGARSTRKPARSGSAPETTVIEEQAKSILVEERFARPDVRPVDQPVPRLRARLRLLLRAADAQLSRPLARARLRDPDHRQGQRRRAPARGACAARPTCRARSTSARRPTPTSRSSAGSASRARSSR